MFNTQRISSGLRKVRKFLGPWWFINCPIVSKSLIYFVRVFLADYRKIWWMYITKVTAEQLGYFFETIFAKPRKLGNLSTLLWHHLSTLLWYHLKSFAQRSEAYSEFCPTSAMELFAKIVDGWKPLTIFEKDPIVG